MCAARSTFVNRYVEALPSHLSRQQHLGLEDLLRVYSPVGGIIKKVVSYFGATGTLPVHVGHCEYLDIDFMLKRLMGLSSLDTGSRRSLFAGGKGVDMGNMTISSMAETFERVLGSLHYFGGAEHIPGTYRQLTDAGYRCLGPDELPLFSATQYREPGFMYEPFRPDSKLMWLLGKRLLSGEEILVPAQMVELVYSLAPGEALIGYSASGGLASHFSWEEAVYHGVTELIERDAVNLRWYGGLPPVPIKVDTAPKDERLKKLLAASEALPGTIRFYLQSFDITAVPVITAIQFLPWCNRYRYYSGGGVDLDTEAAMLMSLGEFGQTARTVGLAMLCPDRGFTHTVAQIFDISPDEDASRFNLFFKAIGYYGYRENAPKLEWYFSNDQERGLSECPTLPSREMRGAGRLARLSEILRQHDIDPILFDMTPRGFHHVKLMKTFIPELTQPFLQSKPIFGHPRFRAAREHAADSGFAPERREVPFTDDPLPYP